MIVDFGGGSEEVKQWLYTSVHAKNKEGIMIEGKENGKEMEKGARNRGLGRGGVRVRVRVTIREENKQEQQRGES